MKFSLLEENRWWVTLEVIPRLKSAWENLKESDVENLVYRKALLTFLDKKEFVSSSILDEIDNDEI